MSVVTRWRLVQGIHVYVGDSVSLLKLRAQNAGGGDFFLEGQDSSGGWFLVERGSLPRPRRVA